jgi:hypothetical protein
MTDKRPLLKTIQDGFSVLVEAFFLPVQGRVFAWFDRLWSAALYLLGLLHWCYFLNWGNIPFDLHDWLDTGAYFSFLRQAALTNLLPLHIGSALTTTDRYLARPNTLISPQAYLLRFLEPGPFALVNVLILYSVGFVALLLLKKRYSLAPAAFTALFALFNFNGHITAHYAVGHSEWIGYFFLPFFVLLILKALEGERPGWRWVLLVSLTLFAITLQGAFHFFLWCLIFLLAWGVFSPKYLVPVLKAIAFSLLLSLFRLLPPAVEFIGGGKGFISGFPTVTDMFAALVVLKYPAEALSGPFKSLGWWEVDTYIGLIGLAFLLYFGVYRTWRRQSPIRALLAPIAVLTFLSIGQIYIAINHLPIPLADSERVAARFLIVPVVVMIALAAFNLQELLTERGYRGLTERILYLGLLILMAHDLYQHSRIWRVTNMYKLFPSTPADIQSSVVNHPDPVYVTALAVGAAGTLLTLTVLLILSLRERRQAKRHIEK